MKGLMKMTAIGIAIVIGATSCEKKNSTPPPPEENKYLINAQPEGGGASVIHAVPDLSAGIYSIAQAREAMEGDWQMLGNGKIYAAWGSGYKEYEYTSSGDVVLKRSMGSDRGGLFNVGNGQLVGLRTDFDYAGPYMVYDLVDVASFTIIATDSVPIFPPANTIVYPTGVKAHGNKLIFTYAPCYTDTYASNDTAYAAVVDRGTLDYEKTIKDIRTCSVGIPYFGNQDGFTYDGDLYIQTSNTDWWGMYESKPSGVLRIKAGQTEWDPTYFFDVSSLTGGYANVLLADVGNGKAITQVHKKELVIEYSDFDEKYVIEHWLLDLNAKTATKLDIPLSKWTSIKIVPVESGKYAIAASSAEGSYFYIFDSNTNNVTRGAQYVGGLLGLPIRLQ